MAAIRDAIMESLFSGFGYAIGRPSSDGWILNTVTSGQGAGFDTLYGFGSVEPTTFMGLTLYSVTATTLSVDNISVGFVADAQVPGVTQITMTIAGAPANPYILTWDGGFFRYRLTTGAAALNAYLDGQTGQALALTLTDSTP